MYKQRMIMLVDDDRFVGQAVSEILQSKGCRVDLHHSPAKALSAFQKSPDSVNLVISDHTMPGMTGLELLNTIHDIKPNLPMILTSALLPADIPPHIMALAKPISCNTLFNVVNMCLSEAEPEGEFMLQPNPASPLMQP